MTTYEKNVQETAEKMAAADGWIPEQVKEKSVVYEVFARIAVAMKAEGFDLAKNYWLTTTDEREKIKQNLGLIKPTDNE